MSYDRSNNPEKPGYIGLRGLIRMEGGHSFYHASLPGTNYSADLGDTIFGCRLGDTSIKSSAGIQGTPAVSLDDAYAQHLKKQIPKPGWEYSFPTSASVPDSTDELFGTDYVPGTQALQQPRAEKHILKAEVLGRRRRGSLERPQLRLHSCQVSTAIYTSTSVMTCVLSDYNTIL